MKKQLLLAAATFALTLPVTAQETEPEGAPSPNQIVDAAPENEWVSIPAEDLLIMELSPDANDESRYVTIQLMPEPFSQGWVENIRTFARAKWYDDITVNRVQDNYVVQWGDPNYDNPEAEGDAKPLPEGLKIMDERTYVVRRELVTEDTVAQSIFVSMIAGGLDLQDPIGNVLSRKFEPAKDRYADISLILDGWPLGSSKGSLWPIHCYGMVGVGRGYSPDTGSGAELYTVIGHAPRHLDRNIALVGRIIEGMEHLSSLPRGSGALGFYTQEEAGKRTPILSVRVASDLPEEEQPLFEYLSTESESFAKYAEARANRRDQFFIQPAGGADICNIPVPVRPTPNG